VEASRWLAGERAILGFGTETVGIDAGSAGGMEPPFPLHNFLLGSGRLGLTQLANLERLPVTGALLVVAPLRLVGGTGSPSRVFAFVPRA
jgi:kynurenine formamidase